MSSLIKPGSKPSPGVILLFVSCGLVLVACLGGIGYFLWLGYMNSSGKAYPPLHTAAIQGNLGEVQRLVESGAPLDGKDLHGNTALVDALQNVSAATGDQYGVAAYLISKGASVNNGTFRLAVGDGNAGIVKAIADRGVKADASLLADYVLWNEPNKKSID